jgi:hypothetical protein
MLEAILLLLLRTPIGYMPTMSHLDVFLLSQTKTPASLPGFCIA